MGFHPVYSHPKNMIFEVLPVSPPVVRPSVMMDPSMRSQDDLTHKLLEIIKSNQQVEKCIKSKSPAGVLDEHLKLLQFHITTLIDNEIPGQPQATQRTGRPIKSICQRIKSKEGRVRGNLMGKRVDFSARTVITAEPNIRLDELGVPENIARNLTFSETVTAFNFDFLQKCVDHGPDPPNLHDVGAKFVTKGTQRKDLRFAKDIQLDIGDVVERHLMDGDYVVFNRQPTLHRMSMMGHRVKVMKGKTFRLNLSVCSSYNADFDGDEMNLFLPCTHDARAEVKELMMVSKNIVSPQANRPVMGIVQDALLASSKLTRRDVFVTKDTFMNIMLSVGMTDCRQIPVPCIIKPVPLWSGKQLFSLVMPKKRYMTLQRKTGAHEDIDDPSLYSHGFADTEVCVQSGELLSGILCKKTLGTSSGGIVHKIWTEGSPEDACDFISNVQFVCNTWLVENGFSVGISDCVFDQTDKVNAIVSDCIREAHQVLETNNTSNCEPLINNILNKARDTSGRFVQKQMTNTNNLYSMVTGGSKGSVINIAQIMACVGQQNVNGQRIEHTYEHRTLPHFKKHDNSPESRGFVQHSYMQGLQPHEFFFHAMGGREGVIDTAIKTSDSGYTQRRLVKAMEDVTIRFDGTVRNSLGDILQFQYGEDGMDGSRIIQQTFRGKLVWLPLDVQDCLENIDHVFGVYQHPNTALTSIFNEVLKAYNVSTNDPYILRRHNDARITPGEMVGVIAAQSLGQPITQLVLNTFHAAGISAMNVTLGVPRLKELMNVSKNIRSPSMRIMPKPSSVDEILHTICGVFVKRFVKHTRLLQNHPSPPYEQEYIELMETEGLRGSIEQTEWSILYEMDTDAIELADFDIIDITTWINKSFNYVWCSSSRDEILIRLFPTNNGYDTSQKMKQLSHKISSDTSIQGYRNITECARNGDYIETNGIDLENILADDRVDPYRTRCNDVVNVFNVLGIEAARQVLVDELKKVIEFDGTYVDYRHIALLVDTMTYKGSLMAITRHGINRTETGVLMRCSFEETVNVITEAAVFAEFDSIKGVTEHIIMGKTAKIGTGSMDVLVDVEKMIQLQMETYHQEPDLWKPSSPSRLPLVEEEESYFPDNKN
jgi:DNA-directed RNA polymerase beta' subunit